MPPEAGRPDPRPLVCILDGSVAMTGALMAARREAALLADRARFLLVLPHASSVADAELPEFERVDRLPIVNLRRSWRAAFHYPPALVRAARQLAKLLRREGCRRLQVNDFHLVQGPLARLFGFRGRIVTWVRIDPRRFGLAGRIWLVMQGRGSDSIVAVSRFIAARLQAPEPDLLFDPPPDWPDPPPAATTQRLVFVGNYIEGKGQDDAIRAFSLIASQFPQAKLVFHGGDMGLDKNRAYRDRLQGLAAASPAPDRIEFREFAADTRAALIGATAAINMSHSESFSLTCLEAAMAGLPVLATRSGGPEEILDDGRTGYLVDVGDVDGMAGRMAELLARPDEARQMGRAGRELAMERFPPDGFVSGYAALFELPPAR